VPNSAFNRNFDFDMANREGKFALVPDALLGYAPSPYVLANYGNFGYTLTRINDPGFPIQIDVGLIGDSIIGSQLLFKNLDRLLAAQKLNFSSMGLHGYNTVQEALYLEHRIKKFPKTLVLGFCLNDFIPSIVLVPGGFLQKQKFMEGAIEPIGEVNRFYFNISALYRLVVTSFHFLTSAELQDRSYAVKKNQGKVKKALARMQQLSKEHNSNFIVVIYPFLGSSEPWAEQAHQAVLHMLAELNIKYLDATSILSGVSPQLLRRQPEDIVHPNSFAEGLVAQKLIAKFPAEFGLGPKQ
jgi:lysophospholipase L1-like esterase